MCIHLKIYEIICLLLFVPIGTVCCWMFFDVFWIFLLLFAMFYCCLPWFSLTIFPHVYDQTKHKGGNIGSILPGKITNPWKLFKPKKPKGLHTFWEVKFFRWFTHIGEHSPACVWHDFTLHTIGKHTKLNTLFFYFLFYLCFTKMYSLILPKARRKQNEKKKLACSLNQEKL